MPQQNANFYGALLVVLGLVVVAGLFAGKPSTTGFAVKEADKYSAFDIEIFGNEFRTCADGSLYGECSTFLKPKFCLNGKLVDYCELCGCDAGEVCRDLKCVKVE
ncbi:hypothetical protein KY347_04105 [Candidatus Woesearchaeota archaeon]|nr:hypothetical protein [Candidatus Woesearchaeota archaeon]